MNVLIACEESQTVCKAFRAKGHNAFSCDIQKNSGGAPQWHIKSDVTFVIDGDCLFVTEDGQAHIQMGPWDLIIAHPPCTYLSKAGAARLYKVIDEETYIRRSRLEKGLDAKDFFYRFLNAKCDKVAIENPTPCGVYRLPPCTQIVQPYEYGDPYTKRTCLWLKGLPQLRPTNIVKPVAPWVSAGSKRGDGSQREHIGLIHSEQLRSQTFPGIASAMAEQWGQ